MSCLADIWQKALCGWYRVTELAELKFVLTGGIWRTDNSHIFGIEWTMLNCTVTRRSLAPQCVASPEMLVSRAAALGAPAPKPRRQMQSGADPGLDRRRGCNGFQVVLRAKV